MIRKNGKCPHCGEQLYAGITNKKGRATGFKQGMRFGRLVAVIPVKSIDKHHTFWRFICDCGMIKIINIDNVKRGKVVSCGCKRKENIKALNLKRLAK